MNQVSYVLQKDLQFTDDNFYAKAGDVFVFTPPQQVVVYRNGNIMTKMGTTQASINGLAVSGILRRDHAAKAEVVEAITQEVDVPAEQVEASLAQADAGQTLSVEAVAEKLEASEPEAPADQPEGTDSEGDAPTDEAEQPEPQEPEATPAPKTTAKPKAKAKK